MKQPLKISIDEKILEMVKDNIPNISEFVEDCFKAYLSFAIENEEERGEELRKAWADFLQAYSRIHGKTGIFRSLSIEKGYFVDRISFKIEL